MAVVVTTNVAQKINAIEHFDQDCPNFVEDNHKKVVVVVVVVHSDQDYQKDVISHLDQNFAEDNRKEVVVLHPDQDCTDCTDFVEHYQKDAMKRSEQDYMAVD